MQPYIVKPNDTLYLIAKEFNVPLAQLIEANPHITNPNLIYEGQTIMIPDMPAVPEQIGDIMTEAIAVIEDIVMVDWESANRRINGIRTLMNNLAPMLQEAKVPNTVIFGMNAAIRNTEQNISQRRTFPAMSQANQITQLLADALDFFNVIIPPDVLRLAYFARQMIVNVEQNDWAEAHQNYRRALTVWQRIQPELESGYVQDVSNFDQVFERINESINRRDYLTAINNANRMLELTDVIAADFEQLYG
ncbi:MAG: LysM domain-containing protein [Eubacteriales bacterium]|nr:LysM domain-containing protein [Eubacteriales bacterium]